MGRHNRASVASELVSALYQLSFRSEGTWDPLLEFGQHIVSHLVVPLMGSVILVRIVIWIIQTSSKTRRTTSSSSSSQQQQTPLEVLQSPRRRELYMQAILMLNEHEYDNDRDVNALHKLWCKLRYGMSDEAADQVVREWYFRQAETVLKQCLVECENHCDDNNNNTNNDDSVTAILNDWKLVASVTLAALYLYKLEQPQTAYQVILQLEQSQQQQQRKQQQQQSLTDNKMTTQQQPSSHKRSLLVRLELLKLDTQALHSQTKYAHKMVLADLQRISIWSLPAAQKQCKWYDHRVAQYIQQQQQQQPNETKTSTGSKKKSRKNKKEQ